MLGEITNGVMQLNAAGVMIHKWYNRLPDKFPDVRCRECVIMPNHFHCIIENVGTNAPETDKPVGADQGVGPESKFPGDYFNPEGEHAGSPLHRVVQRFKTMTTNEYIRNVKNNHWAPFNGRFWQRNYYEHIIRDEKSLHRIRDYILNNPLQWASDTLHPSNNR